MLFRSGLFYTWTPREVIDCLGADAGKDACAWFGISETGNFEGRSIPTRMHARGRFDRPNHIETSRQRLMVERAKRPRPGLDDKVITEWNAMMLTTLAEAAFALNDERWLTAAIELGEFLTTELRNADGSWHRSWHHDGTPPARHVALAHDLAQVPHSTLPAQLCGDAHLLNFGLYGSPERALVLDLNDFEIGRAHV